MTVYDGLITKNILRTDVFPLVREKAAMVLFCAPDKLEYYRSEFGADDVVVEVTPQRTYPRLEAFFWTLSFHSIPTESVRILTARRYFEIKKKGALVYFMKRVLHVLGHVKLWRMFLRGLYRLVPDRSFDAFFQIHNPTLIFTPNMVSDEDMRLLKAAKRHNVRNVGMMKSWDNLNTKAYVSVQPDVFIAQNKIVKDDMINLIDYPENKIELTGFPQWDIYTHHEVLLPRVEFARRLNLDPNKKIILYAAAGDTLAPKDTEVMRALFDYIATGKLGDVQVLLRPHPKYMAHEEQFADLPFVCVDRPGKVITKGKYGSWEFEEADIVHLMNSFAHTDVIVNTASSTCIEATMFDLPNVSIAYDGDSTVPYEISVKSFYDFECIKALMEPGGIIKANNFSELTEGIRVFLEDPSHLQAERKKTFEKECYRHDGKAGERIAHILLRELSQ